MLNIKKIDHVGIRVRDRNRAVTFYELLGFKVMAEGVFDEGHPIIMEHPSGVVINVLGPTNQDDGPNILMDVDQRYSGYTHMALRIDSLDETKAFLKQHNIEITGKMAFKDLRAVFIRDPDRNVIELDEYPGEEPETRGDGTGKLDDYKEHP